MGNKLCDVCNAEKHDDYFEAEVCNDCVVKAVEAQRRRKSAGCMRDVKVELAGVAHQLLLKCPVPTDVEDWELPNYVSERQRAILQYRLDKLDSWLKYQCNSIREITAEIAKQEKALC